MFEAMFLLNVILLLFLFFQKKNHQKTDNGSLLMVLENYFDEQESAGDSNVYYIENAYRGTTIDKFDARTIHKQVLGAIDSWDEASIKELYQFALGVRAGWKQSGLISEKEYREMVDEIKRAVYRRLKAILNKEGVQS
ncbi:hypothetical protein OKZ62_001848 [Vibrio navarrensis]|nr:hypothetical protein [Vibrio navarrensis]